MIFAIVFFSIAIVLPIVLIVVKKYKEKCERMVSPFLDELKEIKKEYISNKEAITFLKKYKQLRTNVNLLLFPTYIIQQFVQEYDSFLDNREKYNQDFIYKEIEKYSPYFDNIEGKKLDLQQRIACVVNDDYNLVLAGAGSGKTLTICGKVGYLVDKRISPKDILCISFTNKVCDELKERLSKFTGEEIKVQTFHKIALDILKENEISYKIADENRQRQILEKALLGAREKDINTLTLNLLVYLDNYLKMELGEKESENRLVTVKDTIDYIKEMAEIERYKRGTLDLTTLAKEKVKSQQELEIANTLFIYGIKYEYESDYKFLEENNTTYRPDFYLPDYDIYIEHFGIDESGKASWLKDQEKIDAYSRGMEWKLKLHEDNNTTLVSTFSYQRESLIPTLLDKLKELGVEFKPCSTSIFELLQQMYDFDGGFLETISSFIKLFKNRGFSKKNFAEFRKEATYKERYVLDLIENIYNQYQEELEKNGLIDFEDMINITVDKLEKGKVKADKYKYIIIDEYQDVSINKINLIKNLIKRGNSKLVAVGDDWQSIYRFAGSEVSLISEFDKNFEKAMIMKIEQTYRNSQELIRVSGNFIKKNEKQIDKNLFSARKLTAPVIVRNFSEKIEINTAEMRMDDKKGKLILESKNDPRIKILKEVLDEMPSTKNSVLLLVRNNYDLGIIQLWIQNTDLGIKIIKNDNNNLVFEKGNSRVTCMTIHKSKGLEADNVVLFDIREGYRGLPDTLGDDNILRFVIASKEDIEFAEDRRLFYVALTRTKNRVYIISRTRENSRFIQEIVKDNEFDVKSNTFELQCPLCGGFLVQIPGKGFYGCENYFENNCQFTIKAYDDKELVTIRKNDEFLKRQGIMGCYLPCEIKGMEWVKSPIGSAAIRIIYAYKVGKTEISTFITYLNKKSDSKSILKIKSFINSIRENDTLDPFKDFEKFRKKYLGKQNEVLVYKNTNGELETVSGATVCFRKIES